MVKRYLLAGLGVMFLGVCGIAHSSESDFTLPDNTTSSGFSIKEETTGSTIARFRGDGNVGIATTNPTEKLEVNGNIKISGTGNALKFPDGTSQTTAATAGGGSGDGHSLDAADGSKVDAVFVDNSGNVGIGTTAPDVKLHVIGQIRSSSFRTADGTKNLPSYRFESDADVGIFRPEADTLAFTTAGAERMRIDISGNVGIGTTSPRDKLDVAGAIHATSFPTDSDMRFKKNIKSLNGALEMVQNLRGVSYDWRTDEFKQRGFSDKRTIGIIAQEVEKIVPEVVHTADDGYKSVEYSKLVPLLIEAIKEQQEAISALSAEVEMLKDRI